MKRDIILMAEDDKSDAMRVHRFFRKAGILNSLREVHDGATTLAYLQGEGIYADRSRHPFPILLLLDLKMPGKSGWDVLEWLRQNPPRQPLGIVVLTGEGDIKIMNRAYQLGAHSFLVKPLLFDDFINLVKCIPGIQLDAKHADDRPPSFLFDLGASRSPESRREERDPEPGKKTR